MPNIKSAGKRLRQNLKRRERNRSVKREVRTRIRRATDLDGEAGSMTAEAFRTAVKKVDQAASKGIIHRNAAARMKSRMAARLKKAGVNPYVKPAAGTAS